ncbi:MAG TPA: hypothetical protein VLG13_01415 [Patescibacteria group bacterium]|nr:hypothetical protein [Patescibacteria group bacterium]
MTDTLAFGLQPSREHIGLHVDVPLTVREKASSLGADKLLDTAQKSNVVTIQPRGEGTERVIIHSRLMGTRPEATNRPLADTVRYLSAIATAAASIGRQDPRLHVSMSTPGTRRELQSGYDMRLQFYWPQRNNAVLGVEASAAMRRMARELRYDYQPQRHGGPTHTKYLDHLADVVNVQVDRRTGVSLLVDAPEGVGLATNRNTYQPQNPVASLESYGITGYKQQLICLVGAVAIATGLA